MGIFWLRLIIASLVLLFLTFPAQAQQLWGIYEENERVKLLLETELFLNIKDIATLENLRVDLGNKLRLERPFTLEPMFPGAPSRDEAKEIYGFRSIYDLRNFYILEMSPKEIMLMKYDSPFHLARKLREDSRKWGKLEMKTIEPDLPILPYPKISTLSSPNCPEKENSPPDRAWSLRNMKVRKAWQFSKEKGRPSKGYNEKIGHPDTGYSEHTDLDEKALEKKKGNNFLEKNELPKDPLKEDSIGIKQPGHGTATGSVIISRGGVTSSPPEKKEGGTEEPGKVTGVACRAILIPYRAIESVARLTYGNIIEAIYKAVKDGCSVISLSLGGISSSALEAAMIEAIARNVIVVAAAGNFSSLGVVYPARYPFCIAVAATNSDDKPWKSSAHGEEVTVSAPGEAVWRALRSKPDESTNEVDPSCGTSYSTANVARVAALWLAHHKRRDLIKQFNSSTKLQFVFKRLLQDTARPPDGWKDEKYGSGIVDAEKLLKTKPDKVREQAEDDFKKFTKKKRESADNNLEANKQMYYQMWNMNR